MRFRRPHISQTYQRFDGVEIRRGESGVVEIRATDDTELARGLGFAHACDRSLQMELVRLVAQGRMSECLQASEDALAIDGFARQMGFVQGLAGQLSELDDDVRRYAEAYCHGVNAYRERYRAPWEMSLLRHRLTPWSTVDTLATIQVMAYIGLAQAQQDVEKLIIEAIAGGVDIARLRLLFQPHLDELDEETIAAVRSLKIQDATLPPGIRFGSAVPRLMASNNWAVAATRSASGHALQCNDPHLECNRLPAVWYEFVGHVADDFRMGISMPGVPGLVMGRTSQISGGFTYGFMDMVDYFIEEIRDGKCRCEGDFQSVDVRHETILRKGKPAVEIAVRSTPRGVLEADGTTSLSDGNYLARAWSGAAGAANSLTALHGFPLARNVEEGMCAVRRVSISCNWLLADRDGRIAYQQSGRMPVRQHSGLHPVLGYEAASQWRGIVPPEQLSTRLDPPEGVLATANDDLDQPGAAKAINLPMGSYRAERIRDLLKQERLDVAAMKRIQRDLYSLQAERYQILFAPLLPDTRAAGILRAWDCRYDEASQGAPLFERVYAAVLRDVFGRGLFGLPAWDALLEQTGIVTDYYHLFDRILLADEEDPTWFGEQGRVGVLRTLLARELRNPPTPRWRDLRQVTMAHILLGKRLPSWMGLDHGPIALEGGRATVVQSAIYRAHGRETTFFPSYRYITDMGQTEIHTALAGGPSDRPRSPHYLSDVARWLSYGYKVLSA